MSITLNLSNLERRELAAALQVFSNENLVAAVKPIIQECAKAIKKDAVAALRRNGSVRSGSLIKAIKIGAFQFSRRRGLVWAAVGVGKAAYEHQGRSVNPSKYAHLVERGHISRRNGPVAAKPFMTPAVNRHLPACLERIIAELYALGLG